MPAARLTDLAAVEAAAWHELAAAVKDKGHAWRVAVLATQGDRGADARSIVLREADPATRELIFFADTRSAKVQQIEAQPEGTMVLWSAHLSWQLRLAVALEVLSSGLAVSSRWARLKMTPAAQDYLSPLPPGTWLEGGHANARSLPVRSTRGHFAVITARVVRMDWLELHAEGQRRAVFDAAGSRWVVP